MLITINDDSIYHITSGVTRDVTRTVQHWCRSGADVMFRRDNQAQWADCEVE